MNVALLREQMCDVLNYDDGEQICQVRAGPKSIIHAIKVEIETNAGIPIREQKIVTNHHKYKDDEKVGLDIFQEAADDERAPRLQFHRLTHEEADRAEAATKAIAEIRDHGHHLHDVEVSARENVDVVLFAVEHTNPAELQHASDSVKNDMDAMIDALTLSSLCMYYVGECCWQDRDFMIRAVSLDGLLLGVKVVPEMWRSDPEVVMYACEQHGFALKFASEELKDNRSVVMGAVNQRGTALMYASEELKSDYYVVLDAVRNNKMAIVHAKGGLREDDDLRAAAGQGPSDKKMIAQVEKIKAKFHELDVNHDGFLSYEEMETLLRKGNPDMEEEEIRLLYTQMDTHQDEKVDFHEFCDYIFGGET